MKENTGKRVLKKTNLIFSTLAIKLRVDIVCLCPKVGCDAGISSVSLS